MLAAAALEVAKTQIGIRESGGSNDGPAIRAYLKSVGHHVPDLWCMGFVYWCVKQAVGGATPALIRHPGVYEVWSGTPSSAKIPVTSIRTNPGLLRPGLIFIHLSSAGAHTGFVSGPGNPVYPTIEGNTNKDADPSRDGDGVYQLNHRSIHDVRLQGFIDLDKL